MTQPPKKSPLQDNYSHHTSPTGNTPQKPLTPIPAKPRREVTGKVFTPTVPDHVVKHSNPVGRPAKGAGEMPSREVRFTARDGRKR